MVRAGKYGRASLDARMTLWSSVIQFPDDGSLYDTFVKLSGNIIKNNKDQRIEPLIIDLKLTSYLKEIL